LESHLQLIEESSNTHYSLTKKLLSFILSWHVVNE